MRHRHGDEEAQGGPSRVTDRDATAKNLIRRAYLEGERLGLEVWTQDEAGPYQTVPYPGSSWEPEGEPRTSTTRILPWRDGRNY